MGQNQEKSEVEEAKKFVEKVAQKVKEIKSKQQIEK